MSAPIDGASAHAAEPARNVTMPATMTGFLPRKSASLPQIGMVTVIASM